MITSIRFGQWETNSSSVHQIVIKYNGEEHIPADILISNKDPLNGNYYRDQTTIKFAYDKLNIIISAILNYENEDWPPVPANERFYAMFNLIDMLKELGIKVSIDKESFIETKYCELAADIIENLYLIAKDRSIEKLSAFLFNDESYFATEDNNIYYEGMHSILTKETTNENQFIVTDDY